MQLSLLSIHDVRKTKFNNANWLKGPINATYIPNGFVWIPLQRKTGIPPKKIEKLSFEVPISEFLKLRMPIENERFHDCVISFSFPLLFPRKLVIPGLIASFSILRKLKFYESTDICSWEWSGNWTTVRCFSVGLPLKVTIVYRKPLLESGTSLL